MESIANCILPTANFSTNSQINYLTNLRINLLEPIANGILLTAIFSID